MRGGTAREGRLCDAAVFLVRGDWYWQGEGAFAGGTGQAVEILSGRALHKCWEKNYL